MKVQPTQEIPFHLKQYVAEQDYDQYTSMDQASWRFILRISKEFFKEHGHADYLKGLDVTGITTDSIPKISDIDEKLKKIGWRAVVVTGFIPSEAFLELLSLGVLPIACDMRKIEHIDYTPAPDIVHEAAGHAPMLVNAEYASSLRKFGEVSRKVIFGKEDMDVYKSVLELSEIKEDPYATSEQVNHAQFLLEKSLAEVSYVSEAQRLTRFSWWSTEYGLFKEKDRFLIFGAGLLSSVGESYSCLSDEVEKKYLDLKCVEQSFDITRPQPQLFYVHSFKEMESVVDELSNTMAYKIGGRIGLEKALQAKTVTTTQLDSGLQVGGVVDLVLFDDQDQPIFIKWSGPVQLGVKNQQIEGHGPLYHHEGFSSPFGRIKGIYHASHLMNANDLEQMQLFQGGSSCVEFESGFKVEGEFKSLFKFDCSMLLISFTKAKVTYQNKVYFDPSWGDFDMAMGAEVKSVYGGAPDRGKYFLEIPPEKIKKRKQKNNLTPQNQKLNELYLQIRKIREEQTWNEEIVEEIVNIKSQLDQVYSTDWLLRLEILELIRSRNELREMEVSLRLTLDKISQESKKNKMLIERGLKLLEPAGN